jgi:hypothetical protein
MRLQNIEQPRTSSVWRSLFINYYCMTHISGVGVGCPFLYGRRWLRPEHDVAGHFRPIGLNKTSAAAFMLVRVRLHHIDYG